MLRKILEITNSILRKNDRSKNDIMAQNKGNIFYEPEGFYYFSHTKEEDKNEDISYIEGENFYYAFLRGGNYKEMFCVSATEVKKKKMGFEYCVCPVVSLRNTICTFHITRSIGSSTAKKVKQDLLHMYYIMQEAGNFYEFEMQGNYFTLKCEKIDELHFHIIGTPIE